MWSHSYSHPCFRRLDIWGNCNLDSVLRNQFDERISHTCRKRVGEKTEDEPIHAENLARGSARKVKVTGAGNNVVKLNLVELVYTSSEVEAYSNDSGEG